MRQILSSLLQRGNLFFLSLYISFATDVDVATSWNLIISPDSFHLYIINQDYFLLVESVTDPEATQLRDKSRTRKEDDTFRVFNTDD